MNEDGTPFRIVIDNTFETRNVVNSPKTMLSVKKIDDHTKLKLYVDPFIKNIEIIAINSGKARFINCNFLIEHLSRYCPSKYNQ